MNKSVELEHVSSFYRAPFYKKRKILNNVSLELHNNKIYGLLGANGAGKTTLIKTILGLIKTYNGTLRYFKKDKKVSSTSWLEKIGYVPEEASLVENISGRHFLETMAGLYEEKQQTMEKRIPNLLQLTGIHNDAEKKVRTYSKGMKKRLLIAQSLLNDPDMLFLDEPMAGLDPHKRREMRDLFKNYNKNGTGILLSSHELPEIQKICDSVFLIKEGEIILNEELNTIEGLHATVKVTLTIDQLDNLSTNIVTDYNCKQGDSGIVVRVEQDELQKLLSLLDRQNIMVANIETNFNELEDVFFNYTQQS